MQVYVIDVASGATKAKVTSRNVRGQAGQFSMPHVQLNIGIKSMRHMISYIAVVIMCLLILVFIATANAQSWTQQDCKQYAADQVKELMSIKIDQQTQLNIMRKEKICGTKDSAFTCYRKLLTKLERMCTKGELKEE